MNTTISIGSQTLRELGWPQVQRALAARAFSPRGVQRAGNIEFLASRSEVEASLKRIEEARLLRSETLSLPLGGIDDVGPLVHRAAKGAILSAPEVLSCGRVLRASSQLRNSVLEVAHHAPLLAGIAGTLPVETALAARVEGAIEPGGQLRDDASYELQTQRERVRALRQRMKTRIDVFLKDHDFAENLQDDFFSVRGERYVLPIKTSHRSRVPGIVHNTSNSGETVFIEPNELINFGNDLTIAQAGVVEEEQRILAEFSAEIGGRASSIEDALDIIAGLDVTWAAAVMADDLDAWVPEIVEADRGFRLRNARHPQLVLEGKAVVANDIELTGDQATLVVSGPNAGGKTVTITTVGLCALFLRAGLPIPAQDGSQLPLFDGVLSTIGDHQDLSQDLSTFSAHLSCLSSMLDLARNGWLVLIDEIASGTDPVEGAAIARAVMETLAERGARVLVTTHLEEIKALGVVDSGVVNARVGFDGSAMAPNFRLEMDAAGLSNAIEVAERHGIPELVLKRARTHLQGSGALTMALRKLQQEEMALEAARAAVARRAAVVEEEQEQVAVTRSELAGERLKLEMIVRAELHSELGQLREQVRTMMAELQARPKMATAQRALSELKEQAEQLDQKNREVAARHQALTNAGPQPLPEKLARGASVFVTNLGQVGEVVSVDGDSVQVAVGAMRMRVRRADLAGPSTQKPMESEEPVQKPRHKGVTVSGGGDQDLDEVRCDLRGFRVDDARSRLEAFLDTACFKGPPEVVIIHGHGTGALKDLVREILGRSPYVDGFRPGDRHEGGDGVTVVRFTT